MLQYNLPILWYIRMIIMQYNRLIIMQYKQLIIMRYNRLIIPPILLPILCKLACGYGHVTSPSGDYMKTEHGQPFEGRVPTHIQHTLLLLLVSGKMSQKLTS